MAKKEDKEKERRERGQAYVADLMKRVPAEWTPEKRANAEEVLNALVDPLGEGVQRQSDYSRAHDELREKTRQAEEAIARGVKHQEDNVAWRAVNVQKVSDLEAENARYKAMFAADPLLGDTGGDGNGDRSNGNARPDTKNLLTKEEAEEIWNSRSRKQEEDAIGFFTLLSKLQTHHLKEFNEVLDGEELVRHATKAGLRLDLAYNDFVKDRVEERTKKSHEEEIAKAREEGKLEGLRAAAPGTLPYAVGNNEPTVLGALGAKDKSEFGLSRALDDYWKMQAGKT